MHRTKAISLLGLALVSATLGLAGIASGQALDNQATGLLSTAGTCSTTGHDALSSIVSLSTRESSLVTWSRDVDLDDTDVLLGIALANNGINRVDFDRLASIDVDRTDTARLDQSTDIDRDAVLSAIALGVGGVSSADALACATDIDQTAIVDVSVSQDTDLDEDTTLLAIALARNGASSISFEDVASGSTTASSEITVDRDVDVDRDAALLLLAFGP